MMASSRSSRSSKRLPFGTDHDKLDSLCEQLNYTTFARCDGCALEAEGTMLHTAVMTALSDYRLEAVLFLCARCAPDHYLLATTLPAAGN